MTPTRRLIRRRMLLLAERLGPQQTVLEIGIAGDDPPGANREFFKAEQYVTLDKDEQLHPDLLGDIELEELRGFPQYDLVICSQVLEHCWRLKEAVSNLWRLTAPGGHAIMDMPFCYPPHGDACEPDYWRATPDALRKLCERAGFTVLDVYADPDWLIVSALCRRGMPNGR